MPVAGSEKNVMMKDFSDFFQMLKQIEFVQPYWFLLLLLILPLVGWQIWKKNKIQPPMLVTTVSPFMTGAKTWRQRLHWLPLALRILTLVCLVVALARPQSAFRKNQVDVEGVDIVLALDVSGSMEAMDFKPNRLGACKKVASEFIEGRPTDRIGLVVYAGEAYTQCPVTTDHNTLQGLLRQVDFGAVEDGTAIGDGLGTAINRLRESEAKSKVIILLSDGVNNAGYLDPYSSAEMARDFGIRVYTIGCGTNGQAPYPGTFGPVYFKTEIDEELLKAIASKTGGQYFRATNTQKLKEVYAEIDKMEKTLINEVVFENKADEFLPFLLVGLFLFLLEIVLRMTLFKMIP